MEEKDVMALLEKFKAEIEPTAKKAVEDSMKETVKGYLTQEQLTENLEAMGIKKEFIDEVNKTIEAAKKQGDAIRDLQQKGRGIVKTLPEILAEHKDAIEKITAGGSHKIKLEGLPIRKTTIGLSSVTSDPMGMFLPNWAEIQQQRNTLASSLTPFTLGPDSHGVIYWTDQTTRTNNAAARSDGSAAAEQVYAWTGYSETVDNVSAMVPVHKEALKHISILQGEIERLLTDDVLTALDGYCYTGTGTAPQIGGLYSRATAFDAAAYLAAGGYAPPSANFYDLIVSMAAQIMKATKYFVDRAWVNPYDAKKMQLSKDADGNYLMPPFVVPGPNGMIQVSGMQVIESNSVTAGTCVVGDSRKATLYNTGNVELEIGYNLTGDFAKRIVTILANMEASLLIRNAEVDAFLSSTDIDSDIAAISGSGS